MRTTSVYILLYEGAWQKWFSYKCIFHLKKTAYLLKKQKIISLQFYTFFQ